LIGEAAAINPRTSTMTSPFTGDLVTHLKIWALALVASFVILASLVVFAVAVDGLIGDSHGLTARAATDGMKVKADKPAVYSRRDGATVR
jgi:hypothetical protein